MKAYPKSDIRLATLEKNLNKVVLCGTRCCMYEDGAYASQGRPGLPARVAHHPPHHHAAAFTLTHSLLALTASLAARIAHPPQPTCPLAPGIAPSWPHHDHLQTRIILACTRTTDPPLATSCVRSSPTVPAGARIPHSPTSAYPHHTFAQPPSTPAAALAHLRLSRARPSHSPPAHPHSARTLTSVHCRLDVHRGLRSPAARTHTLLTTAPHSHTQSPSPRHTVSPTADPPLTRARSHEAFITAHVYICIAALLAPRLFSFILSSTPSACLILTPNHFAALCALDSITSAT
ncbi:hypothetical protein FIBSPDRAFT_869211 [Athelia psychrophila]|uniref:Uncharacterized protein n=1 Tax=Athelia psychrophila TaxID=1759441 RepID=A0A166CD39_9AGAM|nr:hypothetical protein FIBSPDRAFT_869211 [Fibularhizoctonia sp. CBS 109695]